MRRPDGLCLRRVLGWLAERSGSILPGMLLHLVNNALAFLTIYLRYYAPAEVSFGVELFILLFFPAFGAWMICNARRQGFSFSAGLRPGVDVLTVLPAGLLRNGAVSRGLRRNFCTLRG